MDKTTGKIPEVQAAEIRRLAHDLSNALEIIVQTHYLLGMVNLDESAEQWRKMMGQGLEQATHLNRELREYIMANSEH